MSRWYLGADVLVERNNHGHAVILWLSDNSSVNLLHGLDGRVGWLSNSLGKVRMYDDLAEQFKDQGILVHSRATYFQAVSIDGSTLRAPGSGNDDRADSLALANLARARRSGGTGGVHV
ncbi:MAG: hypothetical protein KAJ19_10275 [Gammaproteobacteria bacterium]|nr:hypothetical protein [Gammaproteobacteria bacterium]